MSDTTKAALVLGAINGVIGAVPATIMAISDARNGQPDLGGAIFSWALTTLVMTYLLMRWLSKKN